MLSVTVISPEEVLFEGQAGSVILPGEQGVFEVLPLHKDILSCLVAGKMVIDGKYLPIHRGIVKVENGELTAVVERPKAHVRN